MSAIRLGAGELDRRITIEQRTDTTDPVYRTRTASWILFATAWAQVQEVLPSRGDREANSIDLARRPCRVRMRWRGDVTSDMRMRWQGRTYRIVSAPVEIGRRQFIEFMAEETTTAGTDP